MVRRPEDAGEQAGNDQGEWEAVRAARSRMMRDRVRDRAMRNPEVEALDDYWAPGSAVLRAPGGAHKGPPGR